MSNRESLHRTVWTPAQTPKAAVVLVHGAGEHCGRYEHAAAYFTAHGYEVLAGDLPGHGRSPGIRGHIDSFDEFIDVAAGWIAEAEERTTGRPVFLLGHSMGGLISLRLAEAHPAAERLAGIIASSPALRIKMQVPAWKLAAAKTLKMIAPRLLLPSGVRGITLTRDADIVRAALADPYMHNVMSAKFYYEFTNLMEFTLRDAGLIRKPVCILHGGADELIDPAATEQLGGLLTVPDREISVLPGLHHEIMNEPERREIFRRIVEWMDRRVSAI